jgi:hypothetical protein
MLTATVVCLSLLLMLNRKLKAEMQGSRQENCMVVLQLFDNSVYQVGGPGGVRYLPEIDQYGHYHITGSLQIADKGAVKEMVGLHAPLFKVIGQLRKLILTPLARYWLKPCCENPEHHTNYSASTYLPALGSNVFRLREHIRDALFTCRTRNFRVICPIGCWDWGPCWMTTKPTKSVSYGAETSYILCKQHTRPWRLSWTTTSLTRGRGISTHRSSIPALLPYDRGSTTASSARTGSIGAPQLYPDETPTKAQATPWGTHHAARVAAVDVGAPGPTTGTRLVGAVSADAAGVEGAGGEGSET